MNPFYHSAVFLKSAPGFRHLPLDDALEVAFAGRSNSGKSSALNLITNQRGLAKTSKTPGRTQAINYFQLGTAEPPVYLVDLPGYGYAKVPEKIKQQWEKELSRYFVERKSLRGMVLMMDIRRLITPFDQQMLLFCEHRKIPVHILLSKCDKLSRGAGMSALAEVRRKVCVREGISVQLFSALKRIGVDEVHAQLDTWFFSTQGGEANTAAAE